MNIAIVLGTRPEIIKMSVVVKELERQGLDYFIIHTGQHYDFLMDKIFFNELGMRPETINLNVGSGTHSDITGKALVGLEKTLLEKKPDIVLVEGDTNSVLAASLVCVKLHIALGHVEAGLRSYDRRMPEEYNRIICDHVSDFLFAPTKHAEIALKSEGIGQKKILYYDKIFTPKIILTGNTIVDVVYQNLKEAKRTSKILFKTRLKKKNYFLVTAHREENVDKKDKLLGILKGLKDLSDLYNLSIIYPIHPRTKRRIKEFGLSKELTKIKNLKIVEPLSFFDLLTLESNAKLILTDSGGMQEEACTLKIPCVVLRDRSDRQESVEVGASLLSGCDPQKILQVAQIMLSRKTNWRNPFGDGKASKRIVRVIKDHFKN